MQNRNINIRNRSTNTLGQFFSDNHILQVWNKGKPINGYSLNEWRYDICGKPIKFTDYGRTASQYGWEIDHIFPVAKGGIDRLDNLQPLQWESNRNKSDTYPWYCS